MLIIDASSDKKDFNQVLEEYDLILSRETANCVCDAIDMGLPKIRIAILKFPGGLERDMITSECMYAQALQKSLRALIKAEEFELCAKIKEYHDRLVMEEDTVLN